MNAAQSLLAAINLGIYTDAFLLAGYADCDAAVIARLTAADLARVQTLSKIPILPQHQQLILEGSRQLGESLVSNEVRRALRGQTWFTSLAPQTKLNPHN